MLLVDEGHPDLEALQVDDDEEDEEGAAEGEQIGGGGASEGLVHSTPLAGLGHEEVHEADEGALELDAVFGRQGDWAEQAPEDVLRSVGHDE